MSANAYYRDSTDYFEPHASSHSRGRVRDRLHRIGDPFARPARTAQTPSPDPCNRSSSQPISPGARGTLFPHHHQQPDDRRHSNHRKPHRRADHGLGAPLLAAIAGGVTGHKVEGGALGAAIGAVIGATSVAAVEKIAEERHAKHPSSRHHKHRRDSDVADRGDLATTTEHRRRRHSTTLNASSPRSRGSSHVDSFRNRLLGPAPPVEASSMTGRLPASLAPVYARDSHSGPRSRSTNAYADNPRTRRRRDSSSSCSTCSGR